MEYKTGTYFIVGKKNWACTCCDKPIPAGIKHFARIKEFGPVLKRTDGGEYQEKTYTRYHMQCALMLDNLNDWERNKLGDYFKELPPQEAPATSTLHP